MRRFFLVISLGLLYCVTPISAQTGPQHVNAFLLQLDYGVSYPGGDLKQRFGRFSSLSVTPVIYFHKPLMTIGPVFHYHFGRRIKVDALSNIRDEYGHIIGSNTQVATVVQRMRGIQIGLHGSKIFNFSKTTGVHGIETGLSIGYFQQWIRLQDDSRTATQLLDAYIKGYDKLCGGYFIEPHIAYTYMSANRRLNLKAGIKFNLGFTESLRTYNYNTFQEISGKRKDNFITLFFNYSLPIYFNSRDDSQYYY